MKNFNYESFKKGLEKSIEICKSNTAMKPKYLLKHLYLNLDQVWEYALLNIISMTEDQIIIDSQCIDTVNTEYCLFSYKHGLEHSLEISLDERHLCTTLHYDNEDEITTYKLACSYVACI